MAHKKKAHSKEKHKEHEMHAHKKEAHHAEHHKEKKAHKHSARGK